MIVSLIAAASDDGVIGRDNDLPWHMPADLRRFKALTLGHHVLMGRKTWESMTDPLPGRTNIVITRRPDYRAEGGEVARSLDAALDLARERGEEEAFVLGGGEIFRLALDIADRIYLTRIHARYEGDTTFPAIDPEAWHEVESEAHPADDRNPHPYDFLEYRKT